ncbi:hypothetical protein K491DRAFT_748221 [Lophiostoma macrostomum CBS 122681]|uniref:Box C/D snoRNA protein 1 n=1 Tax=Lophiostoma macrostomum CBS 122681 TaxID=1314788 RepID=A0A6A6TRM0_9PLEO|nr:hypothetical protein K491DRAFT_748221 [Lophiostoma macrostomum CBS 122681]
MAEPLLSDLCSICTTKEPKYRCPGCAARTCSLPCYKRHQQRAQCSGKRDPTRYVKKSQLATPAGIDHDFNFLTSVERSLEKAERHVNDSGLSSASSDVRKGLRRSEVNDGHFAAAGVTVVRAPKGLSRHKDNNTHRSTKRNIVWSVEWIHEDKSRSLSNTSEQTRIAEAYHEHLPRSSGPSKKRKRCDVPASRSSETDRDGVTPSNGEGEFTAFGRGRSPRNDTGSRGPESSTGRYPSDAKVEGVPDASPHVNGTEPEPVSTQYIYFLLRPRTSSNRHVLIPLSPSARLGECLRGRTVLEFPTIYVFSASAPELPEDFILEQDYLRGQSKDQKEFEQLLKEVDPSVLRAIKTEDGDDETTNEDFDSTKLLDVLKQDLGTAI